MEALSPCPFRSRLRWPDWGAGDPVVGSTDEFHFVHNAIPHARTKRSILHTRKLKADPQVHSAFQQLGFRRVKRGYKPLKVENLVPLQSIQSDRDPTDPYFEYQWYLKNTGQNGGKPRLDLNVEAAWAQGFTGRNVTTAIMDDGIDYMHPDLRHNYNARASWDFSSNDPYPYPRYTDDWFNSHGTRCAGEVSAARDNGVCGVGIAYDSLVAGIRMLDQPYMTDLIEANSMGHEPNLIHIYSASWGPTDDGKTVDGPRNATMKAIVRGVNETGALTPPPPPPFPQGRNGLGNIYATTDLYGKCTKTHSEPPAAGCRSLRPKPHLTVLTSKRNSLFDAKHRYDWHMNGVGLEFNHLFGFGVLDAGAMVALARDWVTVPPRYHCQAGIYQTPRLVAGPGGRFVGSSGPPRPNSLPGLPPNRKISVNETIEIKIETDACAWSDTEVNYLEHVQAVITLNASRRGDVELFIVSPMDTK
ncbi:PC2-like protein [Penaeus vannamei]|uniref:Neuroendocrine convertase 2 n=1 Tax=Penaeus vannamei TaxID=6689 RepID=A0A423S9Q2_PENVA|nr:PC2-like protein [Penaeus vannamei]